MFFVFFLKERKRKTFLNITWFKFTITIRRCFLLYIPEDPTYSTPDVSNFFFSGRYVRASMCKSIFFFNYFGSVFRFFLAILVPRLSAKISSKNRFWETFISLLNFFRSHRYRIFNKSRTKNGFKKVFLG